MAITNEERYEIAENLRTMTVCGCKYKEQFYELLEETVMPEWEFHSFDTVADRLADLIEPEPERTCRMKKVMKRYDSYSCEYEITWFCSECDNPSYKATKPNYCHNCGARVEQ